MKRGVITPILTVAIVMASATSIAQRVAQFQDKLQEPAMSENFYATSVNIHMDESATKALDIVGAHRVDSLISGYRIGIYLSNASTARAQAEEVVRLCKQHYPDVPTTMRYDNPYFKVSAGYCRSVEEAVMLLNNLSKRFSRAYLVREQIPIERFSEMLIIESDTTATQLPDNK